MVRQWTLVALFGKTFRKNVAAISDMSVAVACHVMWQSAGEIWATKWASFIDQILQWKALTKYVSKYDDLRDKQKPEWTSYTQYNSNSDTATKIKDKLKNYATENA